MTKNMKLETLNALESKTETENYEQPENHEHSRNRNSSSSSFHDPKNHEKPNSTDFFSQKDIPKKFRKTNRKDGKTRKNPARPKKAMTPYYAFIKENRPEYVKLNKGAKVT